MHIRLIMTTNNIYAEKSKDFASKFIAITAKYDHVCDDEHTNNLRKAKSLIDAYEFINENIEHILINERHRFPDNYEDQSEWYKLARLSLNLIDNHKQSILTNLKKFQPIEILQAYNVAMYTFSKSEQIVTDALAKKDLPTYRNTRLRTVEKVSYKNMC